MFAVKNVMYMKLKLVIFAQELIMASPINPSPSFCDISFCFMNENHSKTANILLNRDLNEKGFDIAFINDPYFYNNEVVFFSKQYKVFVHNERPTEAIIIINKNYHSSTVLIERDMIIINIDCNGVDIH